MAGSRALSYHSYLLRFWRDDEESSWRAMLEEPHTGQSHHFPSMEKLYQFLNERMDGQVPAGGTGESEGGLHGSGADIS